MFKSAQAAYTGAGKQARAAIAATNPGSLVGATHSLVAGLLLSLALPGAALAQNFPSSLANTVTVTAPNGTTVTATDTDTLVNRADLLITKTVNDPTPDVGETVTFTITVTNQGPAPAVGVVVNDLLPNGYTHAGSTPSVGTYVSGTGVWTVGTLANAAVATLTVQATVRPTGSYGNTATATTTTPDPTNGNNTATSTPTPVPVADLSVTKTRLSASPVLAGGAVNYQIVVQNLGPSAVAGATFTDVVPANLAGVTWTCSPAASCSATSGTGNVNLTLGIAAAGSVTVLVQGTAPTTTPATVAANTAQIAAPAGTTDPTPGNNSSTTPAIPVSALAIDAVNNSGTVANGANGGTAVANVLGNDTFNGAAATLANVVLTQVSTTNANVTLNPATGAVTVAAGTAAGTYTVVYRICEPLNPTNCDNADVVVTVGAGPIDAVNNSGTVANGANGGTAVANVLGNDTINGAAATLANVNLTQVSTTNPNVTLNPATGAVTVAAGTAAGTYTVVYRICEPLNPTNCDNADVVVTVGAGPIDAVNNSGTVANGANGGTAVANVLGNDTINGAAATLANVILTQVSTTNPNVTLNPATGAVTVAAGTAAGTYTVVYRICEPLNPTNCDNADVAVTVGAGPIDAQDDTGTVSNGATGGTAVVNVLANDTVNGVAATVANVVLTQVSTTNPNVTLDPLTGEVNVAAGTPVGTYTVVYQICEPLNPANCNLADVVVTVGAAPIDAQDDSGTVSNGATGGMAVADVLSNDTVNGVAATLANVVLTQVSTTNPNVTLDPLTGEVNVASSTATGTYTVVYRICEPLNPANCNLADVVVTVGAAPIDAQDDAGTVSNGAAGGTALADVLTNDTINGNPATIANVVLTQVSTTNPNVTLDPLTGEVNVAPGTAVGTYTVVYQICEPLNPANCNLADVVVTVGAAPIDAQDDTGTVTNGATGGTAVADVLANDTINGNPATIANVVLTQVSTTNPNVALDPLTGEVNVAAGTPVGTYTVVYQICEPLNPANCSLADVVVTVGAAPIDAQDDAGTVANGAAGGTAVADVLTNDTVNGVAATLATVTLTQVSTTNPNVTLDPSTGEVNVAPGTPVGTYTVVYQICEPLNPANCSLADVVVTVGAAPIDAQDDAGTVANGATGGTAVADVLANDTINGNPATLANIVLTQVSTTSPNVTVDPLTGEVNVAAGTATGTYTVVYQICEPLNPANCNLADVVVTVGAAPIDAQDDTGTVTNGATGGTAVADVLANDTINGNPATIANVVLTQVSTTNPNVTLDPLTGEVNVAAGTPVGSYTVVYQICEPLNPANCSLADVLVTVGAAPIDAQDDAGTVSNGATGGTAVANVLGNDTVNGVAATVANVALTQVSTTNPSVTLDPLTGEVNVAAGTAAGTYTVIYQICEPLNPANCNLADVVVTVGAAPIDAQDDAGTVSNGATGGIAVTNVLTNDTVNGVAATVANVVLTQVSTTNPNVTLDPATGEVSVAAGTPVGTYTVVYQICEPLNPANCSQADVVVTVGAAPIDAQDDTGSVSNGATGGIAVADVLANDTINGNPATPANVLLTQVSTTNPNVILDPLTGEVVVAPGTAVGTYTVVYQICEPLNPANCENGSVVVTVGAAPIDAQDDTGSVSNGAAGGTAVADVLSNDTVNGVPATLANVVLTQVSTTNPNVTLDPLTGEVDVATGTPVGTYTVVYQICEPLNPANCSQADVVVTVGAAPIDAQDDAGTVSNGATGGTAVTDVLANDTINGNPATIANVVLTQVSTTHPNVTLDSLTGEVNVAAGTPVGTYTVVYQICEPLNPANCENGSVTVTVGAAPIDAQDDAGTVSNGATGGTAVVDVLVNDSINGTPATLANVVLTQVSTTHPNVTLDPLTGEVVVAAGTAAGTYTVVYQICEPLNPANCGLADVVVTVGAAPIDAQDDAGTVSNGATGGTAVANVLGNDTVNGVAATVANVTLTQVSTSNPNVTLDPLTGEVNVAAGTAAGTYTVVYQICEPLNPSNCNLADVVVTVGAAPIDAQDDTGTVSNGATGGTAVADVLANDTVNGVAATVANVVLTQVSTTNPNVTLDPLTGEVNVAPGTATGTYTVVYQICEPLNPANCSLADVVVTVGAAPIDAQDDAGTVPNGATGGTAVADVLVNDTINGNPATLANVVLTQVSTTHPNVTLDPLTGEVNVAAGTPVGTYTVIYQICEPLNPANCENGSVTVTVGAAPIDAQDDVGTVSNGAVGGTAVADVLANDTINGVAATVANVTLTQVSTTNPNVTLDPLTGEVVVAAGTATGTYTVVYQICEPLNPANCSQADVVVTVGAAPVNAQDDAGTVANGATGGTAIANVLVNDTVNGIAATVANVILTQVSTTNPNVTLDPLTGEVNVAPGTAVGTYTVVYQICEPLNPANCSLADVVVTVGAAPIDAQDDAGTVANGTTGGTAVMDVLANDTINGNPATLANVVLTQVSTTSPNVTLDPLTGTVSVASATAVGTYTVRYQICEPLNPANCSLADVVVTVGAAPIDAQDDAGTVSNGTTGGTAVANVLGNDTVNGVAATLATMTLTQVSTTNPNVTLDPLTGEVNVAAGTPVGTYTVVYQICEPLNPANCNLADVVVTVGAAPIDAQDDAGTVGNGATGGTAVANVLGNDTVNGVAATLATVTLTQVSTTNPNVTLDPLTGEVNVAAGTPAGSYTVVYQICEPLNPANCSLADVVVTVGAAPIDAQDDAGAVSNGATGGTAVADVLANDTVNGVAATLANVVLTQVSTSHPNVTLDPLTGEVNVAAGTAVGTYTVVYQICEPLNPANCNLADVAVTVGAAPIDAQDDAGTVSNGATGGTAVVDVLVNDSINGTPATLANVVLTQVSTTNPNVTLDPLTGEVNVAAGTAAGTYTVVYQICEPLNPANCSLADIVVTVGAAPIDAQDDVGTVANGADGGTAVSDVLANDTVNGVAATVANVTLTQVSTTNPNVTLDPLTGEVNVAAGTAVGTYTVVYQICEPLNPVNCNLADVVVTVGAAPIDAQDDTGTVSNGATGGTAVVDVLANDTINGTPATLANVVLTQISTTNPNVTLDPLTGTVSVAPGTAVGTYTVVYQICEPLNPANCSLADVVVTVGAAPIDAQDDAGTVANGATGGTAVADVLANDTINGNPATLANVVLTQVSTTNPNVTLDPLTGEVNVAAGTPVGTYTVVYQICEPLNPANCSLADVVVTVGAAPIDAQDDAGTVSNGATGGTAVADVLANDTVNGVAATLANIVLTQVSTTSPNVTLDPLTGEVNVAAGTPVGTYTVAYQICEPLNPANCSLADVVVTVGAAPIDAQDDAGTVANGATGGTAVADVLVNDTINGNPATLANVVLTQVSTTNPNVTLDPLTGVVSVAPGTAAGTYTVVYQICEPLNPANCSLADIVVTVGAAPIDAQDDVGTVANGADGGTAVSDVLANDTVNGVAATVANVALTQVSTSNPNVTLDPLTGEVNVAAGTAVGTYTVIYQICEPLNPANCSNADVVVTVGAAPIDAQDDAGTVSNGAMGGTAVADVLANDTVNGVAATVANVILTQVSTTNPNVTLDPLTGEVNVAAGTPVGTYTVVYQICEPLNPANCSNADVVVTVGAAPIDAQDDAGTVSNGAMGGTAVANVLANDTVNGVAATLATVTLTQVSTTNPNVTLDPLTGEVNVAAGTPVGSYTVVYQICEPLNPANCSLADVVVTVGAAPIDAQDDTGTVTNGAAGGTAVANVLANDTINGVAATVANVLLTQVSTTNPNVTLDPLTGEVSVAPGTAVGTYTVVYQICEPLNPANCSLADVVVTVGAAPIDAQDDAGTVANGAAGGTAVANVLANDTVNGVAATVANVILTQVSTTNPNVTLDTLTGEVNVASGTAAGTYTVVYQICEPLNPANCSQADVVVIVGAAPIDAQDDAGTVANGATGGTAVADVLANDTINGNPATLANVVLTQVSTTNPNVTLDPLTGEVNVTAGTAAGTYTVVYQICEPLNPANCSLADVIVTVGAAPIDAQDDAGTVANGAVGGTAVVDVLTNDTVNGVAATVANVVLTQVSTTNPNVTLDPATGEVNVTAGTPVGTYTVVYQICEPLNPANCNQADVVVIVGAAPIDAQDDAGTVANGAAGGTAVADVLVNDTVNGVAATVANVVLTQVSTTNPNVTLNPATGAVVVAAGTSAGSYTVVYQICEPLNPANCSLADVVVTVGAAPIDAQDDTGTVSNGTTGGTAVSDVLANDTINGNPATLANVVLTQISTTNPNVTLDPLTGMVSVAPGTAVGTYTVVYQICEPLNPANCSLADVVVTVGAAPIDAQDDTGTVSNGTTGGTAVADVLANDTVNGNPATLANVVLTQISTTNSNVTLDLLTGEVNVAAGTAVGTYTVVYQICEPLNPANCSSADVIVTVGAAPIDAQDDAGTVSNGTTGGAAVADVLVNDTINGNPATLANVVLTQVSTTNPNVTLDPLTGEVNVAPGTAVGTYTVVYQICEPLNPANCSLADVVVTVGAAPIDAQDDAGAVSNGAAGGTAVADVLTNDTVNGAAATLATVTLTQVSTTNPNVTLDPLTGEVNVAAGTAAGTYTVAYQICEPLNPANCDLADVVVTVGAAPVDAVDDAGALTNGATGGTAVADVLVNDTINGTPATLANIVLTQVSTTNPNVTLDPLTGEVNVAAGTAIGTYTVVYQICELLNPANCDLADVVVTVGAAPIDAVDDVGAVANGATGGTAVADVLANDTINGNPATLANIVLTQVSTTNPNVTLDPLTGVVSVAPGTAAGTYTVVYQICEPLNPANCDNADVVVTVGAAPIDAQDDAGTVVNGATGGTAVADVLANDSFDGAAATLATVTLAQVSTTHPNVTLDPSTGAVGVAPGTAAGSYTVTYEICEVLNPANCDSATVIVTVTVSANVIDAVDDNFSTAPVDGSTGGTTATVFTNDTLAGVPFAAGEVVASVIADGGLTGVSIAADGTVSVPAGTVDGTYEVTYRICEAANPGNCDDAVATIVVATVPLPTIAAVDDAGTVADGTAGGVAVANVLVNDDLDGAVPALANVVLSQLGSSHTGVSLDPATGAVAVAPGTPEGVYTLDYRVCSVLEPTLCDEAVVTVTVGPSTCPTVDGTVTGVVFLDRNRDGVRQAAGADGVAGTDDDETPLQSLVALAPVAGSSAATTRIAVANGAYTFAGVAAGRYVVQVQPGYLSDNFGLVPTGPAQVEIEVAGCADAGADFGFNTLQGGSVGDFVWFDVNRDGVVNEWVDVDGDGSISQSPVADELTFDRFEWIDINGNARPDAGEYNRCGLPGVTVELLGGNGGVLSSTVTSARGSYAFNGLPFGQAYATRVDLDAAGTFRAAQALGIAGICKAEASAPPAPTAARSAKATATAVPQALVSVPAGCGNTTAAAHPGRVLTAGAPNIDNFDYGLVCDASLAFIQGTVYEDANKDGSYDKAGDKPIGGATVNLTLPGGSVIAVTTSADGTFSNSVPAGDITVAVDTATLGGSFALGPGSTNPTVVTVPAGGSGIDDTGFVKLAGIAPVAVDDAYEGVETTPVQGRVGDNDSQGDGAGTYVLLANGPGNGALDFAADGSFTYTANPGFVGTDRFDYQLCDADGDCATATVTITIAPVANKLRIQKAVGSREVVVGELVRYTLVITNIGNVPVLGADVIDVPPGGFAFVPGSAVIEDADQAGSASGTGPITFSGIDIPVNGTATIRYLLRVGAGLVPGEYVNEATVYQAGVAVSNSATAAVITGSGLDPDFEQTRVWGKVFDDRNGDGWQDADERGIPGVRLATVEGLVAETDAHGRYHFEGLVVSNQMRGQNFVVKVDKATLPDGTEFTTANPLLRRITPAVPTRFDFGVRLPPPPKAQKAVTLDLGTVVFAPGSREFLPQYAAVVREIASRVREHDGGEVSIETVSGEEALAFERAVQVRDALAAELGADAGQVRIEVVQPDKSRLLSVGADVELGTVLFDTDKATIRAGHEALLDSVAKALADCGYKIVLTGHADVRGDADHNQALALRRAEAVRQAIEARLTPEERTRLRVETQGATAPGAGQ